MPRSNVAKGAYYKGRTKKWLESKGWQVGDLEVVRWVGRSASSQGFPVKRDQFGSDLIAVSRLGILFVQVKGGKTATGNFPAARREFEAFTWPTHGNVNRILVAWTPRARAPRVLAM